jgi:two-component system, OmpR family, sensor kinase
VTRRRTFTLVLLALVLVFVLGAIATITNTRRQLIDDIDAELTNLLDVSGQIYNELALGTPDQVEMFADIDVAFNALVEIIVEGNGPPVVLDPAGPANDPLPPPQLSAETIMARVGEHFTVDSTGDGPSYRVSVEQIADGRYLVFGAPLDGVDDTIKGLSRTLFVTLAAMVTALGAIIFVLQRASFRPYDDLVETAEAIADGDMDRRAITTTADPEIRRLTASLNTMLDRLQSSFEQRQHAEDRVKQFAADASHELRTPLTTIAGYSESYLLGAATDPESVRKQMARINSEAHRTGRLVNDLLVLARLDQDHRLDLQPVDLNSIVTDAAADARVTDPSHRLHVTLHDTGPVWVAGDRDALQQVIVNLIDNTRTHAPGARVDLVVRMLDGTHAAVSVTDDGPGMSHDIADKVFDRFFRSVATPTSDARSSGLGLSIVASIVDTHDGTIDLDTCPGAGSTFTVTLPTVSHSPGSARTNRE